jgi:hypothetical protein
MLSLLTTGSDESVQGGEDSGAAILILIELPRSR